MSSGRQQQMGREAREEWWGGLDATADCLWALRVLHSCTVCKGAPAHAPELASWSMLANRALLDWSVLLLPDVMGMTCSACCTGIDTLWGLRRVAASRRRRGVAGLKAS